MPMDDPSPLAIVEWIVGILIVLGGGMLAIIGKMVKSKKSRVECDLIHNTINLSLNDIKERLGKGDTKMDSMKETLVEISTTLRNRSLDETKRYDRHTNEWKDK